MGDFAIIAPARALLIVSMGLHSQTPIIGSRSSLAVLKEFRHIFNPTVSSE